VALRDSLILLAATAVLTGLLVPLIKGRMDDRRAAVQRQASEDLARDSGFVDAQTELLNRLSTDLWRIVGKILAVSYYAVWGSRDQFGSAWNTYDSTSFDEMFELRANVSRSQRLLSRAAHEQLASLHDWWQRDVDFRLSGMARGSETAEAWQAFHREVGAELFRRCDTTLRTIARDVGVIERRERIREPPERHDS
jgi:hypothetical protein